jgi:hypothetical protein
VALLKIPLWTHEFWNYNWFASTHCSHYSNGSVFKLALVFFLSKSSNPRSLLCWLACLVHFLTSDLESVTSLRSPAPLTGCGVQEHCLGTWVACCCLILFASRTYSKARVILLFRGKKLYKFVLIFPIKI